MEFARSSGLSKKSYFLSNEHCFFHRFADSGFKNKWTGLWHAETKFIEFFAARADGEWLSEERCRGLSYNGVEAVHTFRLPGNTVTQRLFLPGTPHLVMQLSSSNPCDFELELAVNIRKRNENRTTRQYAIRQRGDSLKVYSSLGSLGICSRGMRLDELQVYREHWPSGEPQNYFTPGTISLHGRQPTIVFTPSFSPDRQPSRGNLQESLNERRRMIASMRGLMRTDSKPLERGFFWSALATEFCRKKARGLTSWYAGLPWFQHFWARDIFWVIPSLMALGYFEDVRGTLGHFAKSSEGGRIPNLVSETEGKRMNAIDPTPLWIISLESYIMNSGDLAFLRRMRPFLEASISFLFSCDSDNDGYMEHDLSFPETWMDTLKRESRAVDIQALYFRALLSAQRLLSILPRRGNLPGEISSRAGLLKETLERDFFQNGFFADRLFWRQAIPTRTANALVPLLCGFGRHSVKVLDAIESEPFTTGRGVRSRAGGEPDFSPGGYHTGAAWSLTTAWACAAEFLSGRPLRGWRYLKTLLNDIDRDSLGCIGECWNSSDLSLSGSPLQLWGSGFVPRLVDEFMLGIDIDSINRTIAVSPYLPPGTSRMERIRRTGLGTLRLSFRKSGKAVKASCSDQRFRMVPSRVVY